MAERETGEQSAPASGPAAACSKTRQALSRYTDGMLSPDETEVIEAHLSGCAGCSDELERLRKQDQMLAEALTDLRPSASRRFRVAEVCAAIHRRAEELANSLPQRGWAVFRWLLACAGTGLFVYRTSLYAPPASPYEQAMLLAGFPPAFWINLALLVMALCLLICGRLLMEGAVWLSRRLGNPSPGPSRLEALNLEALGILSLLAVLVLLHFSLK